MCSDSGAVGSSEVRSSARTPSATLISSRAYIRLWPAVLITVLQLVLIFAPAFISPGGVAHFLGAISGPVVGVLLLTFWWLFASRLRWRGRIIGLLLFIGTSLAVHVLVHPTMKPMTFFYVLPTMTTAVVATLVVTQPLSWPARRRFALLALVITGTAWTTLRVRGLSGGMQPEFAWRWAATAEQRLLSDIAERSSLEAKRLKVAERSAPGDWPGFRGPSRDGRVFGVSFPTKWDQQPPRELWRRRVGPGWSSFAVIDDLVFTQEQRGRYEAVVCYDAETGREHWSNLVAARFWEVSSGPGPRATPTFYKGRLYTLGATGVLQCLDPANGQSIWKRELAAEAGAKTPMWGFASSPLVVDELVIVFAGAARGRSVVAYDRSSGKLIWATGDGTHSYSSAHLARLGGIDQVLMWTEVGLRSYGVENGRLFWRHDVNGQGQMSILQPTVVEDTVILGAGYGPGSRRLEVRSQDGNWSVRELWTSTRFKPYFNDVVYHDGHCYGFHGRIFCCIDAETGELRWRGGPLRKWASTSGSGCTPAVGAQRDG